LWYAHLANRFCGIGDYQAASNRNFEHVAQTIDAGVVKGLGVLLAISGGPFLAVFLRDFRRQRVGQSWPRSEKINDGLFQMILGGGLDVAAQFDGL
jgi:hypothetical protein